VKIFLDTNVLVAACLREHPHHESAQPVMESVHLGNEDGFTSAHAVLEVYSTLTRLPGPLRIVAAQAMAMVQENILKSFKTVALTGREYAELIGQLGVEGIAGGQAYDVLHLHCAMKCEADRIYTFHTRHFQNLAPSTLKARIVAP
jgi:toxin FitB